MKINEVEKKTGLTKKAIRLYEDKGLINVDRKSNAYRDYDEDVIKQLELIKLFRNIGISIADIKIYIEGLISLEEMIVKRMREIERENAAYSQTINICREILTNGIDSIRSYNREGVSGTFNEIIEDDGEKALGIDIGTTTISACVVDISNKTVQVYTISNDCAADGEYTFERIQSIKAILNKVTHIIDSFKEIYSSIKVIGFTGQMHGIVYVDKNQKAVSDLISWQDERANEIYKNGKTYVQDIYEKTGCNVSSGFGFATHYYNTVNHIVPENAVSFCTAMDYIISELVGEEIIVHSSNAASFGLFDVTESCFKIWAINKLGMTNIATPQVTKNNTIAGYYKNIPVAVAIGDNQASFFGAVKNEKDSVLLNYGTGSQISVISDIISKSEIIETRPYINGKYLLCGAALCGGKAYALLQKFFSEYVAAATGESKEQYKTMNSLAEKAYAKKISIKANTFFEGTRKNPAERGSIINISADNFTAGEIVVAFLESMAKELYDMYLQMPTENKKYIVASGNAVQKNSAFRKILENMYKIPLEIPEYKEEAAFGAALYAFVCIGENEEKIKDMIKYMKKE